MDDGPRPEPPPRVDRAAKACGSCWPPASGTRPNWRPRRWPASSASGLRPGEIAVVVRHMKTWGRLLEDVFASCGIPCQVDERLTLDETGLGHAFLAGLRGVAGDDPAAVLKYLRSPFSGSDPGAGERPGAGLPARDGARGGRPRARAPMPVRAAALDELAPGRRAAGATAPSSTSTLRRRLPGSMLENGLRSSAAAPATRPAMQPPMPGPSARSQDALSGLSRHQRRGRACPPASSERTSSCLRSPRMAVPGGLLGSEDAVQVLTAHRARARRFQAVLILGLVEGEFPGRADRPALLTAAQRARLDAIGGGLFSPEADQEEALFVRAVSRAWKVLLLSARDADDGGGYAGQSYYWSHCKDLLGVGEREHVHRTLADQVFDLAGAPTPRQYLRACAARASRAASRLWAVVARASPEWGRPSGPARLRLRQVLDELAATGCFSPSALESYLRCPFVWFVERVIGVEDMETVVDDRLVGELLHTALQRHLPGAPVGRRPAASSPRHLRYAERTAGAIIEALVESDECPGTASERRLVEWRLKRMAANLFAMEVAAGSSRTLDDTELQRRGRERRRRGRAGHHGAHRPGGLHSRRRAVHRRLQERRRPGKKQDRDGRGAAVASLHARSRPRRGRDGGWSGGAYLSPRRDGAVGRGRGRVRGPSGRGGAVPAASSSDDELRADAAGRARAGARRRRRA